MRARGVITKTYCIRVHWEYMTLAGADALMLGAVKLPTGNLSRES